MTPSARRRFLAPMALLLGLALSAKAQVTNGNLETWSNSTTPAGWNTTYVPNSGATPTGATTEIAGITAGSTQAAYIPAGGVLWENSTTALTSFSLSFVIAATDPGSSTARSFNLVLGTTSTGSPSIISTYINLRAVESSPGVLALQAYNGSAWTSLGATLNASVYSGSSFTTLNAYDFTINVTLGSTPSYSISYVPDTGGTATVLSNVNIYQGTPGAGSTLGAVLFNGASSASGYAVDNIVLAAVPEPGTNALLALGCLAFAVGLHRANRRRLARVS